MILESLKQYNTSYSKTKDFCRKKLKKELFHFDSENRPETAPNCLHDETSNMRGHGHQQGSFNLDVSAFYTVPA
jgi:hypothetical protein